MQAIILAGGRGERLHIDYHKCMINIGGNTPILEYSLTWLRRWGIFDFMFALYYLPHIIQDYFSDGTDWGVHITYSLEPELMGTAGAVKNVAPWFSRDEPFLIYYGDNLCYFDLWAMQAQHNHTKPGLTMVVHPREDVSNSGAVQIIDDRIVEFQEKTKQGPGWVNAGIYIVEPELLDILPDISPLDFGRDVFPMLLKQGYDIRPYKLGQGGDYEQLFWVDTPEDLRRARDCWRAL